MNLQEKIDARRRERETEERRRELEAWRQQSEIEDRKSKSVEEQPENNIEASHKSSVTDKSPPVSIERTVHPDPAMDPDADKEIFQLKFETAPAALKGIYYFCAILSLIMIIAALVALFDGDFLGALFLLIFGLFPVGGAHKLIEIRKPSKPNLSNTTRGSN